MPLNDTGLLARYYVDEAGSGTTPVSVLDSSGNSYDLTTDYGSGNLAYAEPAADQRGLESTSLNGTQRARKSVVASDVIDVGLDGTKTGTVEVVVRVDTWNSSSRLFGVNNRAGATGVFILRGESATELRFAINNTTARNNLVLTLSTRTVLHVVVDTAEGSQSDRIKVYQDGVLVTSGGWAIAPDTLIDVEAGSSDLIMMNRDSGGSFDSSYDGVMFYSAIYSVAMTPTDVANNESVLALSDDAPATGSSPNVNPTGSSLQTLASGNVVFGGAGSPNIIPVGSALLTLASDVVTFDVNNTGIVTSPTGSSLLTLASGVTVIQITLVPVEVSPTGDTTGTLDENSSVDIRNPLQIFLGGGDSNGFFALASGIPLFTGQIGDLTVRPQEQQGDSSTISAFGTLESGTPVLSLTTAQDKNVNPIGVSFPLLQPQPQVEPDNTSVQFGIDTDFTQTIGNAGSTLPAVGSGVLSFTNLQTGVLGTLPGSTLGLLTSNAPLISQSHPTAPPGTTGGRLIIRAVTHNITRPVTLTTEIQIAVATG